MPPSSRARRMSTRQPRLSHSYPRPPTLAHTPPHRKLREMFNVEAGEYMMSLCSSAALRQLNRWGLFFTCALTLIWGHSLCQCLWVGTGVAG